MSPYSALSPPPEGEEAQDIGQEFNPHLPPAPTNAASRKMTGLAPVETLPPLPSSPLQHASDRSERLQSQSASLRRGQSQAGSNSMPHGELYHVSTLDLQSFPDEPIGGLTPPRALTPMKLTGNLADTSIPELVMPQIRVTTPSYSNYQRTENIRSTSGSIHSSPDTVISEYSPNTLPYQQPRTVISDFLIDDSARKQRQIRCSDIQI